MSSTQPKGKQMTKGGKQIVEENSVTLNFYRNMMITSFGIYFFLMTIQSNGYSSWDLAFFLFSATVTIGSFQFMNFMAKTRYTESGSLLDSGVDLNMEAGVAEHVKDILILTCVCQVLSFFSRYFWLLWLIVPGKAVFHLWTKVVAPWVFAPGPEQTPADDKKQRKLERKMRR